MKGVWLLSWRHVLHNRAQSAILTLCIAVSVFLPVSTGLLIGRYERDLTSRAATTPLIAGGKGNRFDLTMATLYFRQTELAPVPWSLFQEIDAADAGVAIPIHARFTTRGFATVGTTVEYFELHDLCPLRRTLPLQLGDAVLGSAVAEALELGPGDQLFSDQRELYDIAKPPALRLLVSGVLAETGTPDDTAVFTDVKTAWALEGLAHGHQDARQIDTDLVLAKTDETVVVSGAMIEYNEVTESNIGSFHLHGDMSRLPLSAVVVVPRDRKASTMLKARINASAGWQMVVPGEVIADLMAFVFRIKTLFDTLSVVLAATTALMTVLVILLSLRLRAREMDTLNRIGCSRFTVLKLYAAELSIVLVLSVALAAAAVGVGALVLPDLLRARS